MLNKQKALLLPLMISAALSASLWSPNASAQNRECEELAGAPAGLYVSTEEGKTFLIKDGETLEMEPGDIGYANETELKCIKRVPRFLDWPCSTQAARSRMFATYSIDELETNNRAREIVERYFEIPEVIHPVPNFRNGEFHIELDEDDIVQFSTEEWWYRPDANDGVNNPKRPKTLLISLFVGVNKAVIDHNTLSMLQNHYGDDPIPTLFVFNDSNVVPISYFGANASIEELQEAFMERGIKVAEPPMWELGDYTLAPTVAEYQKFFDIPDQADIPADRWNAVMQELENNGFSKKPIFVSIIAETGLMFIDQPERVAAAIAMGYDTIPTLMNFIEPDNHLARCGPGTPVGSGPVSGATTPIGGANVQPGAPVTPPPPPPPASDS